VRGERAEIVAASDEARRRMAAYGFSFYVFLIDFYRAWAENDLAVAEGIVGAVQASTGRTSSLWLYMLAEILAAHGRRGEALERIEGAIASHGDGAMYLSDYLRLKGQILAPTDPAAAETCLREAIAQARQAGLLLFALRASRALAELLFERERRDEAPALLRAALEPFAPDLQHSEISAARALLARTASSIAPGDPS
jgi:hypothetical protein